ncbi:MAG: hypothetical protein H7Y13_12020 [Sphingobacteriaceae bacterium]|nr:hypothetical protein [Sphingobacteriaceae bacterium]
MAPRKNNAPQEVDPAQLDTYFKKRMYEIGITNTAEHFFKVDVDFPGTSYKQQIFTEAKNGNIEIHYPSLYGGPEYIPDSEREFLRTRIHPENQQGDYKYLQEAKSGIHIFFPHGIVEKFSKKKKIKTLFVIEGEFKCFAGYLNGLDIIGIGGKDLFTDGDKESKDLHPDIQKLISVCDVENLVLILDADLFNVTWNPEEDPNKDLSHRHYQFFNTVNRFREVSKGKVKDVYFSHIKEDYLDQAKGLDDLLIYAKDKKQQVIEDLLKLRSSRVFFHTLNLSADTVLKVKEHFKSKFDGGKPAAFYAYHKDIIGEHEFNFLGRRYQYVKEKGLELTKHQDSFKFVRIGVKYFKIIHVPNSKNILEKSLTEWSKPEIKMDYVDKGFPNFFDTIEKYDAVCNVPDNTENYKQVIMDCYNLYQPLDHEITEGSWLTIEGYLRHVFGNTPVGDGSTTTYDIGMDCMQLKYLQPTQKLPIVCLVNKQRNTGKSTFLFLLREIFKENATIIGTQEINDQFNDDWVTKAVIGIDEGFIEKKVVLERIKSQSTNDKVKLRGMYAGRKDVSFFGWFVLTSNDEENFIPIDKEEIRFWVLKVPALQGDDPDLLKKMTAEIPAFLHYLRNRELKHEKKGRFWFHKDLLVTDALLKIKEKSKGWFAAELKEVMQELFFRYKYHTLYYTLTELHNLFNSPGAPVKYRQADIKNQLKEKFDLAPKLGRYHQPVEWDPKSPNLKRTEEKLGRCYEFRIENFLTESEIREELSEWIDFDGIIKARSDKQVVIPIKLDETQILEEEKPPEEPEDRQGAIDFTNKPDESKPF